MKKFVYYCDRCKKQTDKPVRVYAHDIDLATDDPGAERMAAVELCPDCTQKIIDLLRGGMTNYEAICKLYRDGKEMPDIELATGIPVAAISRVIAKEGLAAERYPAQEDMKRRVTDDENPKRRYTIITDEMVEKMVELRMAGETYAQISDKVGVSHMTVRRYLQGRKEVEQID